jgi:hypothetical protein
LNESIIHCPACSIEIKLNESLAAPLIEATRRDYEKKLADANTVIGKREEEFRRQAADVEAARASIDQQVAKQTCCCPIGRGRRGGKEGQAGS